MKKKTVLSIIMIIVMLMTTLGAGMITASASTFVNPDPEIITGTVTMPSTNYINSGGDFWAPWWTNGTEFNTTDKLEGSRSMQITPNGGWAGDAGLGAAGNSPFTNVPALQDGQLYKFTICFKITNVNQVGNGLSDQLLCSIMGGSSDALSVRICTDLYGSYGSNWIKVVKYADKDMLPNLNNAYFMISGTKTANPITVLFDAISLEIVEEVEEDTVDPAHDPYQDDYTNAKNVTVTVDKNTSYQTMEGMGFFGGMGTLGSGKIYSDAWVEKMVDDLGLSMVRFALDPTTMDANYSLEQRVDYINALNTQATKRGYQVRLLLTVWSPPAEFKTNNSTIDGGNLKDDCYDDYAQWIVDCLDKYKAAGLEVYGLSLQNEPNFEEFYDSCVFTPQTYAKLLKDCVPTIKAKYPDIIIYGSENMLSFEGDPNHWYEQRYHTVVANDATALANIDAFAVHGYIDGVLAEAVENHKSLWEYSYNAYCKNTGKSNWMTETSGYSDSWIVADNSKPGALGYGLAIGSAIKYGHVSAWVHWTGSALNSEAKDEFSLMDGMKTGKRYAASKHFYKFIRYGDLRVKAESNDDTVFATAFKNESRDSFSTVLINNSAENKIIKLEGTGYDKLDYYVTMEDENTNCARYNDKDVTTIRLPKYSMVTVSSYIDESEIAPAPTNTSKPTASPTPINIPAIYSENFDDGSSSFSISNSNDANNVFSVVADPKDANNKVFCGKDLSWGTFMSGDLFAADPSKEYTYSFRVLGDAAKVALANINESWQLYTLTEDQLIIDQSSKGNGVLNDWKWFVGKISGASAYKFAAQVQADNNVMNANMYIDDLKIYEGDVVEEVKEIIEASESTPTPTPTDMASAKPSPTTASKPSTLPTTTVKPTPEVTASATAIATVTPSTNATTAPSAVVGATTMPSVSPTVTPTDDLESNVVKKVKFTKKKIKLKVGKKKTIRVKLNPVAKKLTKAAKRVKWSINKKGKKVVKFVKKAKKLKGKLKVKIKALKKGKAKITCKAPSGKKAVCRVIVK